MPPNCYDLSIARTAATVGTTSDRSILRHPRNTYPKPTGNSRKVSAAGRRLTAVHVPRRNGAPSRTPGAPLAAIEVHQDAVDGPMHLGA
jgi:hypothetical protein